MKQPILRKVLAPALALCLCACFILPASAFLWFGKAKTPAVADFSKNGLVGQVISFSAEDFQVKNGDRAQLLGITLDTLPDAGSGVLSLGTELLMPGAYLDATALDGLRFQPMPNAGTDTSTFTFTPSFSTGEKGERVTVTLHQLQQQNEAPIAKNLSLTTYKNVAITGYFDAQDSDGDTLTFQLTSNPARGAVTLAEGGSSQFVYTPYENKTGKDTFTYTAVDTAGNVSAEATVSIRIEKPDTRVTYADMDGNAAHKAAVRLAEAGIFVGQYCNGQYFFSPDQTVSRGEFLSMAMAATGLEPLVDVRVTGFCDDEAIPTWAKGYVSSALKAGVIRGSLDAAGQPVFGAGSPVTQAEATVMLDSLLGITNVATETSGHWASQAAANLVTTGILRREGADPMAMATQLTRGDVAQMLDGALDVLSQRKGGGWLG